MNQEEEDKKKRATIFSAYTSSPDLETESGFSDYTFGSSHTPFTRDALASAKVSQEQERKIKVDERILFLKDSAESQGRTFEEELSAFGKKSNKENYSESDLRRDMSSGMIDLDFQDKEIEEWNRIKEEKSKQELRKSGNLFDKIGQGARDWGNDLGMRYQDWSEDFGARVGRLVQDPLAATGEGLNATKKEVERLGGIVKDSVADYSFSPEEQEMRAQGIMVKPKWVNETQEEYETGYHVYELELKRMNDRSMEIERELNSGKKFTPDEIKKLGEEKKYTDRARITIDEYLGNRSINRNLLGEGSLAGRESLTDYLPVFGQLDNLGKINKLRDVSEKYERGDNLDPEERAIWTAHLVQGLESRMNYGLGGQAGKVVANMPAFAAEFALTSGAAKVGTAGLTRIATKIGTETTARSVAGSMISNGLTRMVAGATTRTAIGFAPKVASTTMEYMLPNYEIMAGDDGNNIIKKLDNGDDFGKALVKGFGETFIEAFTEQVGSLVEKPLDILKKGLVGKFISKSAAKTGERVTASFTSKVLSATGWNGVVGEVLEEELAEIMGAGLDGREYKSPFSGNEGLERFLVTVLGITAFGGLSKVPGTTFKAVNKIGNMVESHGMPTAIEVPVDRQSMNWANEARTAAETRGGEMAETIDADIESTRAVLESFQTGEQLRVSDMPSSVKSLVLAGQLPTLAKRLGKTKLFEMSQEMGFLPLNEDGSVNEELARQQSGNTIADPAAEAARVPADVEGVAQAAVATQSAANGVNQETGVVETSVKASNATLESITQSDVAPEVKSQQLATLIADIENGKYTDDVAQTTAKFAKMELDSVNKKLSKSDADAQDGKVQEMPKSLAGIVQNAREYKSADEFALSLIKNTNASAELNRSANNAKPSQNQLGILETKLKEAGFNGTVYDFYNQSFDTSVNSAPVQNTNNAESKSTNQEVFPEAVTVETRSKLYDAASKYSTFEDFAASFGAGLNGTKSNLDVASEALNAKLDASGTSFPDANSIKSEFPAEWAAREAARTVQLESQNLLAQSIAEANGTDAKYLRINPDSPATLNALAGIYNFSKNSNTASKTTNNNTNEIDTKDLPDFIQRGNQENINAAKEDIKAGIKVFNSEKSNYQTAQEFADAVTGKSQAFGSRLNNAPIKQGFMDISQLSKYQKLYEQGMTDYDVAVQMYNDLNNVANNTPAASQVQKAVAMPLAPTEQTRESTPASRQASSRLPVESNNETKKSAAYQRVTERLGQYAQDDVTYNRMSIADDAAKAIEFVETNPEIANKIALGAELAPEGITDTAISLAASEQAFKSGNYELAGRLEASRSLRQTRRGQEIVAERGRFNDNSPQHFIGQVLDARMAAADNAKIVYKLFNKGETTKSRVTERISSEARQAKKVLTVDQIKLEKAQSIIDMLTCK